MGSGKTLFAMADVVLPAVKAGRPFFTNITGINLSAISWLTGVHSTMIRYYPVKDIHDVIRYFDDNAVSHDGVFVLDEMKDFIDDDKATSWLESRINITRKMGVDFLFIAQQNKKQYIHPDLVGLCDTCNYFATLKQKGDKTHVEEYYIQGGDPKVVNKVPLVYDGVVRRKKDERVFLTYLTSDSKYYKGEENETYNGLMWYQTRKWKLRFVAFGVVVVSFLFFLMFLRTFYDIGESTQMSSTVKKLSQEVGNEKQQRNTVDRTDGPANTTAPCYTWKMCSEGRCETDIGTFPDYSDIDGRLCIGPVCYRPCTTGDGVPGRGRLLYPGGSLSKGTQPGLHSKR